VFRFVRDFVVFRVLGRISTLLLLPAAAVVVVLPLLRWRRGLLLLL
jgi:hypothetical protein